MADDVDPAAPRATRALAGSRELRFQRFRLVVTDGRDRGKSFEGASTEISIGTAAGSDLLLTDPSVSRHHVAIRPTARGLLVRDLDSTNGTHLNAVRIERAYLAPNAVLSIGETRIKFETLDDETRESLSADDRFGRVLGSSEPVRRIFAILPRIAESDATVLLEGETGTGKSLLAEALHDASARATGPFVVVDCAAIPPTLIESELFGHEKGAFTGATGQRVGTLESAAGGTVFLDEIGELPLDLQPKLLRALEDRTIRRVGGNDAVRLDVRLIAATNRDLRAEVNRNRFRSDLYYRLNTVRLRIPPLRERAEDIPLLVAHFHAQFNPAEPAPPAELIADLARREWPGNVRELRSAVERAVLLGDPGLWREISGDGGDPGAAPRRDDELSFRAAKELAVGAWERGYITELVRRHGNNLSRAARAVRMDRNHLRELLRRYGALGREDDPSLK